MKWERSPWSVRPILTDDLCIRGLSAKLSRSYRPYNTSFPGQEQHTICWTSCLVSRFVTVWLVVIFSILNSHWMQSDLSCMRELWENRRRSTIAFQRGYSRDVTSKGRTGGRRAWNRKGNKIRVIYTMIFFNPPHICIYEWFTRGSTVV